MATAVPAQLNTFLGNLVLDNGAKEAFLLSHDQTGGPILPPTLMMSDPSPSGNFDPQEITLAYVFFSRFPNAQSRPLIEVLGFAARTSSGVPIIHVVRAWEKQNP